MVRLTRWLLLGILLPALPVLAQTPLRLNDIQLLGSHNSYKLEMPAENFAKLSAARPEVARTLEYSHIPLPEQLDLGIRKLELDVFYDPDHELFGERASDSLFPVLHVQNLDDRSSCRSLSYCLKLLVDWSDAHPDHLPIFVSFNAKDAAVSIPDSVLPLAFDETAWQAMDAELRAGLGSRLITPAEVFASGQLEWPLLSDARGRFIAILDEAGEKRQVYASRWRDRAMFATLAQGQPGAAIMVINDPISDFELIRQCVESGYIVRTRADADTQEARDNDIRRRDLAFASGAQLVSTDYYLPTNRFNTGYVVQMQGVGRCNPVRRPDGCTLTE